MTLSIIKSPFFSINFSPSVTVQWFAYHNDNQYYYCIIISNALAYTICSVKQAWIEPTNNYNHCEIWQGLKRICLQVWPIVFPFSCTANVVIKTTGKASKWVQNLCLHDKIGLDNPLVWGVLGPRVIMDVTSDFSRYSTGKNIQDLLKLMVLPWGSHCGLSTHILVILFSGSQKNSYNPLRP